MAYRRTRGGSNTISVLVKRCDTTSIRMLALHHTMDETSRRHGQMSQTDRNWAPGIFEIFHRHKYLLAEGYR